MADAAQEMMESDRPEILTPARFGTPDLADKGIWMTKRIRDVYPHLQDRWILSWLGGITAMNEYRFVHTKNAVLLAQRLTEGLNPLPSVRVWFVLVRDKINKDQIQEGADLYTDVVKWATEIGAMRVLDLDAFSDIPKPLIKERIGGRLLMSETMFVQIAPKK